VLKKLIPILLLIPLIALLSFAFTKINKPNVSHAQPSSGIIIQEGLAEKVQLVGELQVSVRYLVDFIPEHRMDSAGITQQRAQLDSLRSSLESALSGTDFDTIDSYYFIPYTTLRVTPDSFNRLITLDNLVATISEDPELELTLNNSVPLIGAPQVWRGLGGLTGSGQTIVIMDSGLDDTHPFLAGKVTNGACVWNCAGFPDGSTIRQGIPVSRPCTGKDCEHGTLVAGIAAGNRNTTSPVGNISGVAPDAELWSAKVIENRFTNGEFTMMNWIYDNRGLANIAAVNMSFGSVAFEILPCLAIGPYADSFRMLREVGIAPVVGSGNNSNVNAFGVPACVEGAIPVGSTDISPEIVSPFSNAPGSNYSNYPNFLLAPGANITSSTNNPSNSFTSKSGTSFAAPHVSGAFALLKEAKFTASVQDIVGALKETAVMVTDIRPDADGIAYPRINLPGARAKLLEGKGMFSMEARYGAAGLEPIIKTEHFQILNDWGTGSPLPDVPAFPSDNFTVLWTGLLHTPYSGSYTFYAQADDGIRVDEVMFAPGASKKLG